MGNAQGFSSIASIAPSEGFSSETLTGVRRTLPWKTESNKSIPVMEDRISSLLHYCYENIL